MFAWGGLTNSWEKREVKGKEKKKKKERIGRIGRRDKKALLSEQGKDIEENNRMGKTRDL